MNDTDLVQERRRPFDALDNLLYLRLKDLAQKRPIGSYVYSP